jgi:hypothetical protein
MRPTTNAIAGSYRFSNQVSELLRGFLRLLGEVEVITVILLALFVVDTHHTFAFHVAAVDQTTSEEATSRSREGQ